MHKDDFPLFLYLSLSSLYLSSQLSLSHSLCLSHCLTLSCPRIYVCSGVLIMTYEQRGPFSPWGMTQFHQIPCVSHGGSGTLKHHPISPSLFPSLSHCLVSISPALYLSLSISLTLSFSQSHSRPSLSLPSLHLRSL